ncbi:MAG: uncharacterized protein KVP18_004496 [Porospora cf. gigantea A]|uniref:uncharacterized protein n=3 Tax=Porospora cf. gigantea A TaxID=2853593 RepID=UPI0035596715|nr:MAG: hypothetical protein KVP18_004496 [Porospora cf. gigantea A]
MSTADLDNLVVEDEQSDIDNMGDDEIEAREAPPVSVKDRIMSLQRQIDDDAERQALERGRYTRRIPAGKLTDDTSKAEYQAAEDGTWHEKDETGEWHAVEEEPAVPVEVTEKESAGHGAILKFDLAVEAEIADAAAQHQLDRNLCVNLYKGYSAYAFVRHEGGVLKPLSMHIAMSMKTVLCVRNGKPKRLSIAEFPEIDMSEDRLDFLKPKADGVLLSSLAKIQDHPGMVLWSSVVYDIQKTDPQQKSKMPSQVKRLMLKKWRKENVAPPTKASRRSIVVIFKSPQDMEEFVEGYECLSRVVDIPIEIKR